MHYFFRFVLTHPLKNDVLIFIFLNNFLSLNIAPVKATALDFKKMSKKVNLVINFQIVHISS